MKERILELLKRIALDSFKDESQREDIFLSLNLDKKTAAKRARSALDNLIRNYNYFQVQTIDSFINALLVGCAFRIKLSANFNIRHDYEEYLAYGLDALIDKAQEDKEIHQLFLDFMYHYLNVENKTGWLLKRDILDIMKLLFLDYNKYAQGFKRYPFQPKNYFSQKIKIIKTIAELQEKVPEGTPKRFKDTLSDFSEGRRDNFELSELLSSVYWGRKDFPANKGEGIPPQVKKLWDKLNNYLDKTSTEEANSLFNPYIDIFKLVQQEFSRIVKKEDILFLGELNKQANELFKNEPVSVPEIYYRLATRFTQFLIDEFQDTSQLQWKNLSPLVEEALASGGSLFYVGDKKQAIYRFRGGEVSLFDKIKDAYVNASTRHELLSKNFRSQQEIVLFNNEVFSGDNLLRFMQELNMQENNASSGPCFEKRDIEDILKVFQGSKQTFRKINTQGRVLVTHLQALDREEHADLVRQKLLELLKDLNTRFKPQDIAVLVRSNAEVEEITSWLIEEKILVESEKTLNIRQNCLIKELVSFLKFLDSPIDELSFAAFVLGDIFLKASGIRKEDIEDFLFRRNAANKKGLSVYLYKEFRDMFPQAWDNFIDEFFRNIGFVPLYEMLITMMQRFGITQGFRENQGFFMAFLELVKQKEDEYTSVSAFLDYFVNAPAEELYVRCVQENAVKVMTVHKAKGLEFPVVVIPFLDIDLKPGTRPAEPGASYAIYPEDDTLRLISLKNEYRRFSQEIKKYYRLELRKSFLDELNNIYVAFTRPKYELYCFIAKIGKNINKAQLLIPQGAFERGEKTSVIKTGQKKDSLLQEEPTEYTDWLRSLKEEFIESSQISNRDNILKGEIVHYIFSFLKGLKEKDYKNAIDEAIEKARIRFPAYAQFQDIRKLIRGVVENDSYKDLFFVKVGSVFTEKEVVDSSGRTKRIDRLVITKDSAVIVDYKTSKDTSLGQDKQLEEYVKLIKSLYPSHKVRGLIIKVV